MKISLVLLLLILTAGCTTFVAKNWDDLYGPQKTQNRIINEVAPDEVNYWTDVKPVLDSRCIVCHGCYDAPCQLKMTAPEGIDRGLSTRNVYDTSRIKPAQPTRLFEDAHSTEAWRKLDFKPVLNERIPTLEANKKASTFYQSLVLKEENPLPSSGILNDSFTLGINRKNTCPTAENYQAFAEKNPQWGMPYALPSLNSSEQAVLKRWIEQGARYTARPNLSQAFQARIEIWEDFLNQDSLKGQLTARYIFEHLFLANLYFPEEDTQTFFRLVRSKTPPGATTDQITTRRPYDDPGVPRVFYRFIPVNETIIAKTHMPYRLDNERLILWQELFFDTPYEVTDFPSYEPQVAANPFDAFEDIPVRSRHRFLLDEAQFTIMNFIKGPVCRGQVALNVIRDHFWVFFIDPDRDKAFHTSEFLSENIHTLEMPNAKENVYTPLLTWHKYASLEREKLAARDAFISQHLDPQKDVTFKAIWDGDGTNRNAALTVFRHFDTATVEQGLIGSPPQTAWVIGYPLLERIHYLLVAGYDVYGNVGHQVLSRLYMDFLRMEGESNFLMMLPQDVRETERQFWYRDSSESVLQYLRNPSFESKLSPNIDYQTNDPKSELYWLLSEHLGPALNRDKSLQKVTDKNLRGELERLQRFSGSATTLLPEVSYLSIIDGHGENMGSYTLIRNNAHLSITSLFNEKKRLIPSENTVTVANGFIGAYPNAFFRIPIDEMKQFVDRTLNLSTEDDYAILMETFGIRRSSPGFWSHSDDVHERLRSQNPIEFGQLDYNRLENR